MKKLQILFFLIPLFFLGCTQSSPKIKEVFQTNNAVLIKRDFEALSRLLLEYKEKLNLRNPKNYDKNRAYLLTKEIAKNQNRLYLKFKGKYIKSHNRYLALALDGSNPLQYRNDFLILGIYKYMQQAYSQENSHKFSALSYDKKLLKELYYALNVLNWKIKTQLDAKGQYLFLTWQNNWQVELKKRILKGESPTWEMLQNLHHIKEGKETLFSPSNHNFEVLMRQMLSHIKHTLNILGEEPLDVGIEVMKNFVFFL